MWRDPPPRKHGSGDFCLVEVRAKGYKERATVLRVMEGSRVHDPKTKLTKQETQSHIHSPVQGIIMFVLLKVRICR